MLVDSKTRQFVPSAMNSARRSAPLGTPLVVLATFLDE
jgi:hypothetical protein